MVNKVKPPIIPNNNETKGSTTQIVIPCKTEDKKYRVCDVCGHSNPDNIAICEMCSNYLLLGEGD